jgi:hypothetical protein
MPSSGATMRAANTPQIIGRYAYESMIAITWFMRARARSSCGCKRVPGNASSMYRVIASVSYSVKPSCANAGMRPNG